MASARFYDVYLKLFLKNQSKLDKIWEKWNRKKSTLDRVFAIKQKILIELRDYIIKAKNDYDRKEINSFEFSYIKYNLLYLFAKECASLEHEQKLFYQSLDLFLEKGIIQKEERKEIPEMSPLSRWGVF